LYDIAGDNTVVDVRGSLRKLNESEREFASFVCERPHKFLVQRQGEKPCTAAYSPEWGDGASFSANEAMGIDLSTIVLPMLKPRLQDAINVLLKQRSKDEASSAAIPPPLDFHIDDAVALWVPEYTLVDHHNMRWQEGQWVNM
jgi:hypothetical protein